MSVDLPAPFSPASATTSPAAISKSTPLSARTPPKRFSIPRICKTGASIESPLETRSCQYRLPQAGDGRDEGGGMRDEVKQGWGFFHPSSLRPHPFAPARLRQAVLT